MFWYFVGFIILVVLGILLMHNKKNPKAGRIGGVILILLGCCFLYFGHVDTDWSAGAQNWDDISSVNDHVTEKDSEIQSVKNYKGYMLITLKANTVDFADTKSANTADTFDECFEFAKDAKEGVGKKGVIIYQQTPSHELTGLAVFYSKDDLSKAPSHDKMLDDRSLILKNATAYSLGAANFNSTGLDKKGIKIQSSHQPGWFADFSEQHYLGE